MRNGVGGFCACLLLGKAFSRSKTNAFGAGG
jgi:hypothetical protein